MGRKWDSVDQEREIAAEIEERGPKTALVRKTGAFVGAINNPGRTFVQFYMACGTAAAT
jgi:hypothetical protein